MIYLKSRKNFYSDLMIAVLVFIAVGIIVMFKKPGYLVVDIILFICFCLYLAFKKQISSLVVEDQKITIEYYQWFTKRFFVTSVKNVVLKFSTEISFRSSEKKPTINIRSNEINTSINKLDGFDEDEIVSFYNDYKTKFGL